MIKHVVHTSIAVGAVAVTLAAAIAGAPALLHAHHPSKLIISRATTYITGPLGKDGLPDYKLALKQYLMKGVTPENNAAVPAIEIAMQGLRPYSGAKEFDYRPLGLIQLHALKVAAPSKAMAKVHTIGSYFRRHPPQGNDFMHRGFAFGPSTQVWWRAEIMEEWFARDFPWRPSRCLLLWGAIDRNKAAISTMRRASRLPYFYLPGFGSPSADLLRAIRKGEGQIFPEVPARDVVWPVGSDIAYSATLELGLGHAHGCWRDIQLVSRLAALAEQCPGEENSTARSLESEALYACRALIERFGSHSRLAVRANLWFGKRPLWPIVTEHMLHCQRLKALGLLESIYGAATKPDYHSAPAPKNEPPGFRDMFRVLNPPTGLRWNWQSRQVGLLFDRLSSEAGAHISDTKGTRLWHWLNSYWRPSRGLSGNRLYHHRFVCFAEGGMGGDLESYEVQRCGALIKVGFALAAYNAVQGKYPKTLDALSPQFFVGPLTDPFNGKPLLYQRTASGYTLALNGAGPRYIQDSGPRRITVPAPAPTAWQKMPFP